MEFITNGKQMRGKLKCQNAFITKHASHAENRTDDSLIFSDEVSPGSFWKILSYHSNLTKKKKDIISGHRLLWYPMWFDLASGHNGH